MSYEIRLYAQSELAETAEPSDAQLSITSNYTSFFRRDDIFGEQGLFMLDFQQAQETIPLLEHAIAILGTEQDTRYWASTPGNAGYALVELLALIREYPTDIVRVTC